jgi:chromosome segregation ATPase
MPEDQLDLLDRSNALIEDTRVKLKAAYQQVAGNADVQAKIQQELDDLTDTQEQLALDGLLGVAAALDSLSDQLDKAIAAIKNNIDNFLLGDLKKIGQKIADLQQKVGNQGGTGIA